MNEFREEQERKVRRPTWYERISTEMTSDQKASLDEALADMTISASTIAVVLGRWGFDVSSQAVGNYRRRYCV